jgi:capsular polysaccharide biosynthesis protein
MTVETDPDRPDVAGPERLDLQRRLVAAEAEAAHYRRAYAALETAYSATQIALHDTQVALQQTQVALQQTQAAYGPSGEASSPPPPIPPLPVKPPVKPHVGPPFISIDRDTVLPTRTTEALLATAEPGQSMHVPEKHFDVRQHPLSRLPSDPADQATYVDHSVRAPEMTLERLQDHYWFQESGFLVSKTGKVWRHSVLGQFSDPNFLTTYAIQDRHNDDGTIDYIFHESLLKDAPVIDGLHLITSHYASHNYGHYMLDMVPLIAVARDLGLDVLTKPLLKWQRSIYDAVGVAPDRITEINVRAVFLKDVIVSLRHNAVSTYASHPAHRQVFETILAAIRAKRGTTSASTTPKRLFLSRGASKARDLRNRGKLESALKARGIQSIRPETYSFDEQALLFANADLIVSEFGAVMANVVFCKPGTRVIEIIPEGQKDPWSAHMCAALGLEHIVVFNPVNDADREPIDIGGRSLNNIYFKYDADVDLILSIVDQFKLTT